jgi:hypothetical protein
MPTDDLSAVFLASSQDVAVLGSHSHGASDIAAYSVQREHVNAEQRARCDRAEMLHSLCHMSDDALCEALVNGHFPWSNLTSADIRLNRKLRGPCVQCLEGKYRGKAMLPSDTPPAAAVGQCIVLDSQSLTVKSLGGNLYYLDTYDEFSGDKQVTPCKSLKSADIFDAIMSLVHVRYNAYGHRVVQIVVDSLPAFSPVVKMLGMMGILLTFCPPGQHAQRVEAHKGHADASARAVSAGLPYYLPPNYEIYLKKYVADSCNEYPNSRSSPSTADVLVTGRPRVANARMPFTKFGDTCMVPVSADKRSHDARDLGVSMKLLSKSELGVCLGFTPNSPSGSYEFLISNGEVVSRNHFDLVHVHPFEWKRKKILHAELSLPCTGVAPQSSVQTRVVEAQPSLTPAVLPVPSSSTALSPSSAPWHPEPVGRAPISSLDVSRVDVDIPPVALERVPLAPSPVAIDRLVLPALDSSTSSDDVVTALLPSPPVSPLVEVLPSTPPSPEVPPPSLHQVSPVSAPSDAWLEPRQSGRVRRAYDHHAMPPLHSAHIAPTYDQFLATLRPDLTSDEFVIAMRSAPTDPVIVDTPAVVFPVVPSATRSRRYRRLRRSSPTAILPAAPQFDALSHADEALLAPYLDDVRACWAETEDVMQSDELCYDDAVAFLAHIPMESFVSALPAPLPSSVLIPIPSLKCKEVPLRAALRSDGPARLKKATDIEVAKNFRLGAWGKVCSLPEAMQDPGSIVYEAVVLYKLKADDRETCRVAASRPLGRLAVEDPPADVLFSSVASDGAKLASLSAMQAHCSSRGEKLYISDGDVVGGFCHIDLNSPMPLYLHFPATFPHELAGRCVRILHAIYGLKVSNKLFSDEMTRILLGAGFTLSRVELQTYVRVDPMDPGKKCIVNMCVDDCLAISNVQAMILDLFAALKRRFGELTVNLVTTVHTGLEISQPSTGGVLVLQDQAIARAASLVGVSHLPPVSLPAVKTFFDTPVDPVLCVPVDPTTYSSLTGKLVQFLKTRFDVKHYVSELCSHNQAPIENHYRLAIHVLRYLHSTPGVGPLYMSNSPVVLSVISDASFGLLSGGRSAGASLFSIGCSNAPFAVIAKPLPIIALCPMTAEYLSAGLACQGILHWYQFLADLGWPILSPVVLTLDNKTAISLVTAPQVSKKSLWIEVKHHFIRELHSRGIISLAYVPSSQMRANILTKFLPSTAYLRERNHLFNCTV